MRRLFLVPVLGLALVLLLLVLLAQRGGQRSSGPRGVPGPEREPPGAEGTAGAAAAEAARDAPLAASPGATHRFPRADVDGRLVYFDGAPAAGVLLHLAVGRPLETRRFRNRDYTDQTIHLVTAHATTRTAEDGAFVFAAVPTPPGARQFVYTEPDAPAYALEELYGTGQEVRAHRRVRVTGRLLDPEGQPVGDCWLEGQLGRPEDWETRVLRELDCFVDASGDLQVDTLGKGDTFTRDDGSFEIRLVEGENTLTFGEMRSRGSLPARVPPSGIDLGELRVPGPPARTDAGHTVHGLVLNLANAPHAECSVRAWDGSVGLHTHETYTDESGRFRIDGLTSSFVILWAVPTGKWHLDLPEQSSGTLRMPCGTELVLHAPEEGEYAWARFDLQGCYLFERGGVFLGGQALAPDDVVGLPPGRYRIVLLSADGGVLQATPEIREPGRLDLDRRWFRAMEWQ